MQAPVSAIPDVDHQVLLCQAFFAGVAHDLKNPLTSLRLWTDLLQSLDTRLSACGDTDVIALYRTAVEQIIIQAARSIRVVVDVLDMSRLQAGQRLFLSAEPVDLVGLARSAIRARPEASKQERVLNLDVSEPELWGCWETFRTFSNPSAAART